MFVFEITDPNDGLREVLGSLVENGITQSSRNGPVLRFPRPVCLQYNHPQRRLLTSPIRDANPFFHLFETMWMFAGRAEIQPLLVYNPGMAQYSDDGSKLRGTAYGERWRNYPGWGDQILKATDALRGNPDDRRVVLSMWDPRELGETGKDFACNLQVIFNTRPNPDSSQPLLDMTVTNRSNDLIYGAMGSNLFHFSMLLEYVALHSNLAVGTYYQVSSNLHLYTENKVAARCLEQRELIGNSVSLAGRKDTSLTDLSLTVDSKPIASYVRDRDFPTEEPYIQQVVAPLVEAYHIFKMKSRLGINMDPQVRISAAQDVAGACVSEPLRAACQDWLERRRPAPAEKAQ